MLVFATVDKSKGHKGITAFIVERSFPGFSSESLHGKLGVRAGNTGILTFDDCEVPAANRVGEEGEGFTIAMSAIDQGRYTVAAGSVGLAQACLDASVKYAHERKTFGSEIGEHQLVKQMISKMYAGIEAGRLLVFKAGWKKNAGERNTRETGLAKWFCTDHAVASALDAIQVHGAYGYSNEYPVERYLRNSKGSVIYEGTSQIHTLMQADYVLGYRKDRPLRMPQPRVRRRDVGRAGPLRPRSPFDSPAPPRWSARDAPASARSPARRPAAPRATAPNSAPSRRS